MLDKANIDYADYYDDVVNTMGLWRKEFHNEIWECWRCSMTVEQAAATIKR